VVAVAADDLAAALAEAVVPDVAISPALPEIGFVHRRAGGLDVYLLVNTGPASRTFGLVARSSGAGYEQWDPMTGRVLSSGPTTGGTELTLAPYEATVLVFGDDLSAEQPGPSTSSGHPARRRPLSGPWRVAYGDEAAQPVNLPHVWEDQPGQAHYSGAATYTTSLDLDAVADRAWLDFGAGEVRDGDAAERGLIGPSYRVELRGPVGEVAQVRVNGIDCGLVWAPPYRLEVTEALRPGPNAIEIVVYNTAANALAADEHIGPLAAESEARYGRRFRLQDLDQAMATVRSGLLDVPSLVFGR